MKPRTPGQTLLSVAIDQQMLDEIDARRGISNRSAFVRECLAKHLGVDLNLAAAPDRTGKGGKRKKPEIVSGFAKAPNVSGFPAKVDGKIVELPYFGSVAAGIPGGPLDIEDGTVSVAGDFDPDRNFTLRVNGQSMEPDYPDGSVIVCKRLRAGEFAKKGQDVIACDGLGAYFKRLIYTKSGVKGDKPRKVYPALVSINPEFPGVTPVADCPIMAIVSSVLSK